MRSILIATAVLMASFVFANPIAIPKPNAVADAFQFYGASQTATPIKRDIQRRTLIIRKDENIPEAFLAKRDHALVKRTQSPTSGANANKCSAVNSVGGVSYTCGTGNDGPCCSQNGWCGANSYYCGGGCQTNYGTCVAPTIGLTFDADAGDSIWDVTTDNVFDAGVGDGIIYYGNDPTSGWP